MYTHMQIFVCNGRMCFLELGTIEMSYSYIYLFVYLHR